MSYFIIPTTCILNVAHNPLKGELIHRWNSNESTDKCPFHFLEECYEKYRLFPSLFQNKWLDRLKGNNRHKISGVNLIKL